MLEQEYENLKFLETLNSIEGFIKIIYHINSDIPVIYLNKKWNQGIIQLKNTDQDESKKIYNFLLDCSKKIYLDIKTTGEQKMENTVLDNGIKIEINSLNSYEYSTLKINGYVITMELNIINALTMKKNKIFQEMI